MAAERASDIEPRFREYVDHCISGVSVSDSGYGIGMELQATSLPFLAAIYISDKYASIVLPLTLIYPNFHNDWTDRFLDNPIAVARMVQLEPFYAGQLLARIGNTEPNRLRLIEPASARMPSEVIVAYVAGILTQREYEQVLT